MAPREEATRGRPIQVHDGAHQRMVRETAGPDPVIRNVAEGLAMGSGGILAATTHRMAEAARYA
jgi:hypothetical protein